MKGAPPPPTPYDLSTEDNLGGVVAVLLFAVIGEQLPDRA